MGDKIKEQRLHNIPCKVMTVDYIIMVLIHMLFVIQLHLLIIAQTMRFVHMHPVNKLYKMQIS